MLKITTFTDPMMGLSYESEPFFRQLETHFPNQIHFAYVMGGLVRNVADWLLPNETLPEYNARLAKIYEAEQAISGLPISMPKLDLFTPERPSSLPLNLAYKAARLTDIGKADAFLYRLRYATIVEVRSTNDLTEILRVARAVGIDETAFLRHFQDGSAQAALEQDFALKAQLGVRGLPAYLFEFEGKQRLISGVLNFARFARIIAEISDGKLQPQAPKFTPQAVEDLLKKQGKLNG
ncbi:DsbA family protein [Actinobacillus succinogenes]|uniref:DSBA oxidoreductase n=1 Tax=Actinobacillus succinogenes (strain ATCC 55618 / DSM 22257 / CCUG 43843 / 130Z) TaxID=339671 RepID=A6VPW1_ACTSZ|nr:DsbA family protein [Actinobacillus succinogenes]ABR75008.1 DSBA oxidoreductase [Actinobacillus succinogenes 130Z]PHI40584.1 DsbA family protein [Actinobacillus succinogenes]